MISVDGNQIDREELSSVEKIKVDVTRRGQGMLIALSIKTTPAKGRIKKHTVGAFIRFHVGCRVLILDFTRVIFLIIELLCVHCHQKIVPYANITTAMFDQNKERNILDAQPNSHLSFNRFLVNICGVLILCFVIVHAIERLTQYLSTAYLVYCQLLMTHRLFHVMLLYPFLS